MEIGVESSDGVLLSTLQHLNFLLPPSLPVPKGSRKVEVGAEAFEEARRFHP